MKKVIFLWMIPIFYIGCSQVEDNSIENKKIYEFSWCSYNTSYNAQDLNTELISYIGFINNLKEKNKLKKETKYLNPIFKQEKYDFLWLDVFENSLTQDAFIEITKSSEVYKNWLSSKDEIILCDGNKQTFYEIKLNRGFLLQDGNPSYIGFCKLKEGFEIDYLVDQLRENKVFLNRPFNNIMLIPTFKQSDFDLLILLETDIRLKDFDFLEAGGIKSACKQYDNFSSNSLSFDTYILD